MSAVRPAVLCLALASCALELSAPVGVEIGCAEDSGCPPGWTCNLSVKRCVAPENRDRPPPSLVGSPPENLPVKEGAVAVVAFTVDAVLHDSPAVTMKAGRTRTLVEDESRSDRPRGSYAFTYTATGDEPEAVDYPVTIELTDKLGNKSGSLPWGALRFDFTPPSLEAGSLRVDGSPVRDGQIAAVHFRTSEAVSPAPVVRFADGRMLERDTSYSGPGFRYTYRADKARDKEEQAEVLVDLADLAGNRSDRLAAGVIAFDFTPPAFAFMREPGAQPSFVRRDTEVIVSFDVKEELKADPEVKLVPEVEPGVERRPIPLRKRSQSGMTYVYDHIAVGGEDRNYTLTVRIVDRAGNLAEFSKENGVTFDFTPPAVLTINDLEKGPHQSPPPHPLPPAPPSTVPDRVVHVIFDSSEKLTVPAFDETKGQVAVSLGDELMKCPSGLAKHFDCTWVVPRGLQPGDKREGEKGVVISLKDEAGNETRRTVGTVTFDFTPPTVTLSVSHSGQPAGLGADAYITVAAKDNERLDPASVLLDGGGLKFPNAIESGSSFVWTYRVTSKDVAGDYPLTVRAKDLAGNPVLLPATGTLKIDPVAPAIRNLELNAKGRYSAQPGFNTVRVTFDAEDLDLVTDGLRATFDGKEMKCEKFKQVTGHDYECSGVVAAGLIPSETEAARTVLVEARDAAGNVAASGIAALIDFKPPGVAFATVRYVPDASNLITLPARARAGTTILVTANADEPLDASHAPTLTASLGGTYALVFDTVGWTPTSTAPSFRVVVRGTDPSGVYVPAIGWTDAVGNPTGKATFSPPKGPEIEVNSTPPSLTVVQSKIVYVRSPLGNALPESLGGFTIPAGPYFALAPANPLSGVARLDAGTFAIGVRSPSLVRVFVGGPPPIAVGSLWPGADGTWPRFQLPSIDAPAVLVSGLDDAGNESAKVKVRDVEWVATPNQATLQTTSHRLTATSHVEPSVVQNPGSVSPSGDYASSPDGNAVLARAAAAWKEIPVAESRPLGRSQHAVAFDSKRGRLVLFGGGTTGLDRANDTWEWDGVAWRNVTPKGSSPSARSGHGMAYDSARGVTVLFGGSGTQLRNDLWEWDGTSWTERLTGSGPSARSGLALAYDAARRRTVLFGGGRQDTWEWDGVAWVDKTPAGTNPVARGGCSLAFDTARGRVVLFGGYDMTSSRSLQDVWEWDGSMWSNKTPAASGPTARWGHTTSYDARHSRVILFGGQQGNSTTPPLNDVWTWDGTAWTAGPTGAPVPSGRSQHAMAYDTFQNRVVVFGGSGNDDMWEWDGASWKDRSPARSKPYARYGHAMTFDSARRKVVLFGGSSSRGLLQDTFEWNGTRWEEMTPNGPRPPVREGHAMTYDSARSRVVLFGGGTGAKSGCLQDTWEWDGTLWVDRTPSGAKPGGRCSHAMAFDAKRGRTVLLGGYQYVSGLPGPPYQRYTEYADLWEWDGVAWLEKAPAGVKPLSRVRHALAFDAAHAKVVLFGGFSSANGLLRDLWEWNGTSWAERAPLSAAPSARRGHAMVFDTAQRRIQVFGGSDQGTTPSYFQDSWEWDGSGWVDKTSLQIKPSPRSNLAVAYDSFRGRMVAFGGIRTENAPGDPGDLGGGRSVTHLYSDTWEYDSLPSRQPAVQFEVFSKGASLTASSINGIRVRAHCGGVFSPFDTASVGASLLGWDATATASDAWTPLVVNGTGLINAQNPFLPAPTMALLDWSAKDPADAQRFLGSGGALGFQCRPSGSSGAGSQEAAVALDYIEVRVRHAAP